MENIIYYSKREFIQEENATKNYVSIFFSFFLMNIYVNVTYFFSPYNAIIIISKPVGFRF